MGFFKNHNQIYTHSTEYGVIIGQYWLPKKENMNGGRVRAITESGDVILDPAPKMTNYSRIDIDELANNWQIFLPVLILPYQRFNKTLGIQVFAFQDKNNITPYVFGELRRGYEPW